MAVSTRNSTTPEPPDSDERKAALVGSILRGELTPEEACRREGLTPLELKQWVRAFTRAARRAVDSQVAAALAARGLEAEPAPPEFSGSVDHMGVAELIQTIHYGKKDAHIRIDHDGEQSHLWCVEGEVIDACSSRLTGSPAVYRILSLEHGALHADFASVQRARSIHASTQALMFEAAKRSDECRQIRARLGDTREVYVPSPSAPSDSEIEPEQADVLRAFDGTRSIDQVVHDSEFPDLETLGMISRLLGQEWLIARPAPLAPLASTPGPAPASAREGSFIPIARSLASRLSLPSLERRLHLSLRLRSRRQRLWASAAAGVAVVALAFAVGFYSAPQPELQTVASARAPSRPACAPNMAPLPSGACLDETEVTAAAYQACVRAGACEPAQRELAPTAAAASSASALGPGASAPRAPSGPAGSGPTPITDEPSSALSALVSARVEPAPGGAAAEISGAAPPAAPGPPAVGDAREPVPDVASEPGGPRAPAAPATAPVATDLADPSAHCNAGLPGRESHPVNCVTSQQARRYCEWRAGRLPTRAEWDLAGRSPATFRELAGGLSEWTIDGAAAGPQRDPGAELYAILGGPLETRAPSRLAPGANAQGRTVGFRCAIDPE